MNLCTASPIVVVKPLALVFMIWRACSMTLISALTGWLSKTIKSFATFFVLRVPDCDGFETTPFANSNEVHPILRRFWKSSCVSCTEEFERICDKAIYISLSQQTYTLFETWLALLLEFLLPKPSVDCFDMRNSTGGEYIIDNSLGPWGKWRSSKQGECHFLPILPAFGVVCPGVSVRCVPILGVSGLILPRKSGVSRQISSRIYENLGVSQICTHLKSGIIAWDFYANF